MKHYVFSSLRGIASEIVFPAGTSLAELRNAVVHESGSAVVVSGKASGPFSFTANGSPFLVLPHEMALHAYKIGERLLISREVLLEDHDQLQFISRNAVSELHVYPDPEIVPSVAFAGISRLDPPLKGLASWRLEFPENTPELSISQRSERKYELRVDARFDVLNDVFLKVDYTGDRGLAFINGHLVTDHFYHGSAWEIGLKPVARRLEENPMVLVFHPMYPDYEYLPDLDDIPDMGKGGLLRVDGISLVPEYKAILTFN